MIDDDITVVITSSPCRRHPSAEMIEETVRLVREQLDSQIIILLDGVKPEQEYLRQAYDTYKERLHTWALGQNRIYTHAFSKFQHQTGMMKEGIQLVSTSLLLFVEHDFPVTGDIPWVNIGKLIQNEEANLVRFYLENELIPEHRHMFVNQTPLLIGGVPLIKTSQWSQRPHIASTELYHKIVREYLKGDRKTYIEDAIHGYFAVDFRASKNPEADWQKHKLTIYHPEGNISRCKHLDGRMEEKKYGLE